MLILKLLSKFAVLIARRLKFLLTFLWGHIIAVAGTSLLLKKNSPVLVMDFLFAQPRQIQMTLNRLMTVRVMLSVTGRPKSLSSLPVRRFVSKTPQFVPVVMNPLLRWLNAGRLRVSGRRNERSRCQTRLLPGSFRVPLFVTLDEGQGLFGLRLTVLRTFKNDSII